MATLLELTSQGDVGTITDESKLSNVKLMDPQQLYQLWEKQPWSAHAIDLENDTEEWADHGHQEEKDAAHLEPVGVLHRRGARHDPVLRPRAGVRVPERGGVPDDPAGRRGPPRPVLQPLLRPGPGARRHVREPPRGGAQGRQRGLHRALRHRARQRAGAAARQPRRRRGEGRLRRALPHGHRGHARADRPVLHPGLPREEGQAARACSTATSGSRRTSTATSPTAPGSSSRRPPTPPCGAACRPSSKS